jgi:hypothetical protein
MYTEVNVRPVSTQKDKISLFKLIAEEEPIEREVSKILEFDSITDKDVAKEIAHQAKLFSSLPYKYQQKIINKERFQIEIITHEHITFTY